MRLLAFLACLLLACSGAWASDIPQKESEWVYQVTAKDSKGYILVEDSDGKMVWVKPLTIDRFLSSQVQPEIEAGEYLLNPVNPGSIDYDDFRARRAIAHYLKALILIEQERLRRESHD